MSNSNVCCSRNEEYAKIINAELVPATGCTEPIALAYAAAKARAALGALPEKCTVEASGNIIKNVKSVVVPNTNGLKGIEIAAAAGIVAGDENAELQVIAKVSEEQKKEMAEYEKAHPIKVVPALNGIVFYISVVAEAGGHSVRVTIKDGHTNIVLIERDGEILFEKKDGPQAQGKSELRYDLLNVKDIIEYAKEADLSLVRDALDRQIECNYAIARDGIENDWGANVGSTLLKSGSDLRTRAKAMAAAGSDARMNGCEKPVIIVSGSGNQGMAASLPVIEYAKGLGKSHDELLRALLVSDLITALQKRSIGKLSAFCGAVSAGCGAACGIAFLLGYGYDEISHLIVNALGTMAGMVCDGAKSSCASKIAMAVEAGLLGLDMYLNEKNGLQPGEGIVGCDVEKTIANVGRMASLGMRDTDAEILSIMTES